MKKRWIWIALLVVVAVGVGWYISRPETPMTVDTMLLQPQRVEQTINCTGAVESAESTGVFLPLSCVIREVWVEPGQQVEVGDTLFAIDKEATRYLQEDSADLLTLAAMEEQVTAPYSGIVTAVKAKVGKTLEPETPCVALALPSSLQVRVSIREKDLRTLKTGMTVRVTGDGFQKKSYDGILTDISSAASTAGSGAVVEGVITLQEGQVDVSMRLGLTAKAAIITQITEDGLVVPYEAILSDDRGQDYVYVLEEGRAHRIDVEAAAQLSDGILLADPAMQGKRLILQPDKIAEEGIAVVCAGEETP